jgi:hypothetical protein
MFDKLAHTWMVSRPFRWSAVAAALLFVTSVIWLTVGLTSVSDDPSMRPVYLWLGTVVPAFGFAATGFHCLMRAVDAYDQHWYPS